MARVVSDLEYDEREMIEIKGDLCHQLLIKEKSKLSYDESKDYTAWKAGIRKKFIELVGIENI